MSDPNPTLVLALARGQQTNCIQLVTLRIASDSQTIDHLVNYIQSNQLELDSTTYLMSFILKALGSTISILYSGLSLLWCTKNHHRIKEKRYHGERGSNHRQ